MRQGSGGRRSRGRHHSGGNGNHSRSSSDNRPRSAASLRHQTFDSNGPDVRVRGNAWQVYEKYLALARDASSSGDLITAENLLQHAEHYYRIIEAINEATANEQRARGALSQSFGQQPEVPSDYYNPEMNVAGSQASAPLPDGSAAVMPPAEVQRRSPAPSPFFTPEEAGDIADDPESLVVGR